jgi:hypothetical protein
MADLTGNEQRSYSVLIPGISRKKYDEFVEWRNDFPWRDGIGWVLFPQGIQIDKFILYVDHGSYGGTWWREALPEIIEFFGGEERMVFAIKE